ncbi:phosphodiesterase YaeI [Planctomycetes bacterium Poly30]|uniref:Phosphodiesterase YaeI n=1 Tax=Saltatorellus ferox TaxID=2528018 RepID=A0A518EUF2_9BACT|nr:phosphodiesterase YaeI [Planctomycetes bacterium Poly30]
MIEPRRFSRLRLAAFDAVERVTVLLGARRFYRWRYLSAERLGVREHILRIPGLPPALQGITIAHLSDIHAGPFLSGADLAAVVSLIEQRRPDFVCWTGDYVTHGVEDVLPVLPDLRRCVGQRGTFAVFGNHDYKLRREWEIVAALEPDGWHFLRNRSKTVEVDGSTVAFAGIEDPEEGKVIDVDAALELVGAADVVIGLCHGPRGAPAFAGHPAAHVHAVLSGHTHGSQVDLPFLRDLGPPHPGLRVELGGTTVFVARGLGVVGLPLRTGAPAEVSFVTLQSGPESDQNLSDAG